MADLSGKRALVTGGSRGIGAGIARRLAADGADVAITYAGNAAAAAAVTQAVEAAGRRGHAIQADAGDPAAAAAAVAQAADALGGLDILIHNAGIAQFQTLAEDGQAGFDRQFAVNVGGVFAGTAEAAKRLSDGGRIVIIGSVNAHWMPFAGGAVYGATKAAVAQLASGWARDLAPRGITVNTVQPGPIDTDLNPADGELARQFSSLIPLGRYGHVDEVAALVSFLSGPEAAFITGAAIDIDGGISL